MATSTDNQKVTAIQKSYATERWARCVITVVMSDSDTRTIRDWGRAVGLSSSSLVSRCRAAHIPPRKSLDLARLLRALRVTNGNIADFEEALDIIEPRTIARLFMRSGLQKVTVNNQHITLYEFLDIQVLVKKPAATRILKTLLNDNILKKASCN